MLVGSRDALHSLEKVLSTVGGSESVFLNKLRGRMAEVELPLPQNNTWLNMSWTNDGSHHHHNNHLPQQREVEDVTYSEEPTVNADVQAALNLDDATIAQLTESFDGGHGHQPRFMDNVYDFQGMTHDNGWDDMNKVSR